MHCDVKRYIFASDPDICEAQQMHGISGVVHSTFNFTDEKKKVKTLISD